jgi:hypothetical protein
MTINLVHISGHGARQAGLLHSEPLPLLNLASLKSWSLLFGNPANCYLLFAFKTSCIQVSFSIYHLIVTLSPSSNDSYFR